MDKSSTASAINDETILEVARKVAEAYARRGRAHGWRSARERDDLEQVAAVALLELRARGTYDAAKCTPWMYAWTVASRAAVRYLRRDLRANTVDPPAEGPAHETLEPSAEESPAEQLERVEYARRVRRAAYGALSGRPAKLGLPVLFGVEPGAVAAHHGVPVTVVWQARYDAGRALRSDALLRSLARERA